MTQVLQKLCLRNHTLTDCLHAKFRAASDFFYGPGLIGLFIDGKIDHAHAALSDLMENFVLSANNGSCSQQYATSSFSLPDFHFIRQSVC